jgi:hypothetical protein
LAKLAVDNDGDATPLALPPDVPDLTNEVVQRSRDAGPRTNLLAVRGSLLAAREA